MYRGGIVLSRHALHHDFVAVRSAAGIGYPVEELIRFVLLRGLERHDSHTPLAGTGDVELLLEEAAHLLEVEDGLSRLLLAGGGVHFEVRRGRLDPLLFGSGRHGREREQGRKEAPVFHIWTVYFTSA